MTDNPASQIIDLSNRILQGEEPGPEVLREALARLRNERGVANARKKAASTKKMSNEEFDALFDDVEQKTDL